MRRTRTQVAVITMLVCIGVAAVGAQVRSRSFAWYGELVSIDRAAKTLTIKAEIRENATRFLSTYKPGDRLVFVWDIPGASGGEGQTVLAVARREQMKFINDGYITRAEFVAADPEARTITFKVTAPDAVLASVASTQPGRWIKVVAPMEQSGPEAVLMTAAPTEKPAPRAHPAASPEAAEPQRVAAVAPQVKANGGISGQWEIRYQPAFANRTVYMACELAQDGLRIGGACTQGENPGRYSSGAASTPVSGRTTDTGIELQIPPGGNVYTGTLDTSGTKITGTVVSPLTGVQVPFQATKS